MNSRSEKLPKTDKIANGNITIHDISKAGFAKIASSPTSFNSFVLI